MHKGYQSYEEMWEKCPHLHSSSLWKQYYSDEIILRNPKARGFSTQKLVLTWKRKLDRTRFEIIACSAKTKIIVTLCIKVGLNC
jgi:hypothetical protein